jgi:creatinine amidohydrolase
VVLERKVLLENMTWPEAKRAVKESNGIVVIPIGAIEEHGPHLPLDTDVEVTVEPVIRAAKQAKVVVAPTIPWGNSEQNAYFPGTIYLRIRTLVDLIKDIAMSLASHGFDKFVLVNGHGGNIGPVSDAAEEIKYELGVFICVVKGWELDTLSKPKGVPAYDGHGGFKETSLMLYLDPGNVNRKEFRRSKPKMNLTKYGNIWPPQIPAGYTPVQIFLEAQETFPEGHSGDPTLATTEAGEEIVKVWAETLYHFLRELKSNRIKFINRRRKKVGRSSRS